MKLIDADVLIDRFEMRGDSDLGWHLYEVIDEINDTPTAYDVDEVVRELGNIAYLVNTPTYDNPYVEGAVVNEEDAINIVRRGGVNEAD